MITYSADNIAFPPIKRRLTTRWLRQVAAQHGYKVGEVGYTFCNDDKILEVNLQYLNHDYYTDIITFDYTEGKVINGDIFISLDTVRSNALQQGTEYMEELHRVIVHGVLHLCGIDDKGPGQRAIMEREENKALRMLNQGVQE
ncbi:MAG: rRNA maturation RNase YbeY [Prevotellaceae bacterium]|nr:rRNA maturation RNase YbeY [Prevotellaceae bacterium]